MDDIFSLNNRRFTKYLVISIFLISLTLASGVASNHAHALCTRIDPRTSTALPDTDCDALADTWESPVGSPGGGGYDANGDGTIDIDFYALGARSDHKDIFVEIDYLGHHIPWTTSISDLVYRFSIAPVWNPVGSGISLHVYADDNIPNPSDGCTHVWTDFDIMKAAYLGTMGERGGSNKVNIQTAKMNTFHYGLFIHTQCENPTSSGTSEVFGNDFIVSLGYSGWGTDGSGNTIGSVAQQEGVMMHELGHNLNLLHGGNVNTNCKPNYLSVMNYMFLFPDIVTVRPLDYSRSALNTLIENMLSEPNGIRTSTPSGLKSAYGPTPVQITPALNNPTSPYNNQINWDRVGGYTSPVSANINNIGRTDCNYATSTETFYGFNDWWNLRFWGIGGGFANATGPVNVTSSGVPPCDIQDPSCGIVACNPNSASCTDTPCSSMDPRCGVPPCDPADPTCVTGRNNPHTDTTINDIKGHTISGLTHINTKIQDLPPGAFSGPGGASTFKIMFRDKLIASGDSVLARVATNDLGNAILKLTEVKTDILTYINPGFQPELISMTENLLTALQFER